MKQGLRRPHGLKNGVGSEMPNEISNAGLHHGMVQHPLDSSRSVEVPGWVAFPFFFFSITSRYPVRCP